MMSGGGEQPDGVSLTNLDQPLFDGADATKRDLVDYLDTVADHIIPELADRPLSVVRVLRGQAPFMQKNVPSYTPSWVRRVSLWAETSKRDVSYALCNDRRTLLWFANQRAVEYHPALIRADRWDWPTHPRARPRPAVRRHVRRGRPAPPTWSAKPSPTRVGGCGQDQRRQGRARVRPDRPAGHRRGDGCSDEGDRRARRAARPRTGDNRVHPG